MTCPSASIAINCCQLACCIPTIPAIDFPISLHPDWMSNLVQSVPDVALGDIVIPGTHNSASYSIAPYKLFSAVGRTQNVSVLEQLHRGTRFLDIRIAGSANDVYCFHGCMRGCKLSRILDDIHLFCQDFPGEFLVIKVVAEYGRAFEPALKKKALETIQSTLGDKLFQGSKVDELLATPLKDLTMKGTQACVILHSRIYDDFTVGGVEYTEDLVSKEFSCFNANSWLEDKW
jgi:hypothetical protein